MAVVWQFSAIEYQTTTVLSGVLLAHMPKKMTWDNHWWHNTRAVISTYRQTPYRNQKITLQGWSLEFNITTDQHGYFELEVELPLASEDQFEFYNSNKERIPVQQKYGPVFFNNKAEIAVISDIDETIVKSFTANSVKRIRTILFKNVEQKHHIHFTKELYQCLHQKGALFYYVSKSEWNLFNYIAGFIQLNCFPQGALFLSPYLNIKQLMTEKKAMHFKRNCISKIIERSPDKQYYLVGDDTQADVDIYTEIVRAHPNKIKAVYIRQTKKALHSVFKTKWETLLQTGVKGCLFSKEAIFDQKKLK